MTATDRPTSAVGSPALSADDNAGQEDVARRHGDLGTDDGLEPDDGPAAAPRWPWVTGLILTIVGLADAGYLTYAHYTSATNLSCPDKGMINCAKVTTSSYSHIFGMPVAVLGLAFFLAMLPLQTPAAWRSQWAPLRIVRLGSTVVGVGMILWLLYVELFRLDAICLYCTGVHILTLLLFVSTALGTVSTAVYAEDD